MLFVIPRPGGDQTGRLMYSANDVCTPGGWRVGVCGRSMLRPYEDVGKIIVFFFHLIFVRLKCAVLWQLIV